MSGTWPKKYKRMVELLTEAEKLTHDMVNEPKWHNQADFALCHNIISALALAEKGHNENTEYWNEVDKQQNGE